MVGGSGALVGMQAGTPTTTNAAHYARIVAEHSVSRRLIGVAGEISELGYSGTDIGRAARAGQPRCWPTSPSGPTMPIPPGVAWTCARSSTTPTKHPSGLGLRRYDGQQLIQTGVLTLFIGPPESGKSWGAILSAVGEISHGHPVGWIDLEQGPRKVVRDLLIAGLTRAQVAEHLHYFPVERAPSAGEVPSHGEVAR